jgi:hypothetical protein
MDLGHSPLGIKFNPLEKANTIADCLEKQLTTHDMCEENYEWQVEARVQALLKAVDPGGGGPPPPPRARGGGGGG